MDGSQRPRPKRAGETGGHMRSVLFLGTFAVAAIFAGLIVYYFT